MIEKRFIFAGLLALLFLQGIGAAQNQVVISLSANNDGEETVREILDAYQKSAEFRLLGQLQNLKQDCDLTEPQMTKLRVAAKGATKVFVGKQREKAMEMLKTYQARAGFDVDDDDEEDEDEKEEPERIIRNFAFVLNITSFHSIDGAPIWNRSIDKVLTPEQKTKQAEAESSRKEFYKTAAVDHFVAQLENSLFLSEDQRNALRKIIHDNFADILVNSMKNDRQNRNRVVQARAIKRDPEHADLVKDLLNEDQLAEWIRSVEPELQRIKQLPRR